MTVKDSILKGTAHLNRTADKGLEVGRDLAHNVGNSRAWQVTAEKMTKFRGPLLAGGLIVGSVVAANSFMSTKHRAGLYMNDRAQDQGQQR